MNAFEPRTRRYVQRMAAEVCILSRNLFLLKGRLPDVAWTEAGEGFEDANSKTLVAAMTMALYERYYCQTNKYKVPRHLKADLLPALQKANRTVVGCGHDWKQADVREDFTSQPGYYYALGETPSDRPEDQETARLYLNISPARAAQWMRLVTENLNKYRVPFQFKVLRYPVAYTRVDTGVLYLPRRHAGFAAGLLTGLARTHQGLRAETPVFTRRVAHGIAIADNPPGGESFGMTRMRLVAEGLINAWHWKGDDVRAQVREVAARFVCSELKLREPWLNPHNTDFRMEAVPGAAKPASPVTSEWLKVADRIGGQLVRDALWTGDECTWLGWSLVPDTEGERPGIVTVGGDMYAGTAGIAVFLAHLFEATKNQLYKRTALGAFQHALAQSRAGQAHIGAYSGLSGLLYCALTCSAVFGDRPLDRTVSELVSKVTALSCHERQTDIIDGRAGAIRVLLAVHGKKARCREQALRTAIELGDQVLALAHRADEAWSWDTTYFPHHHNLLGYAHGTSGIAAALYELYQVTREPRFREAAMGALRYECKHFDKQKRNWPDFRDQNAFGKSSNPDEANYMCAWCNGAPGTILALARILAQESDASLIELLEAGLKTTRLGIRTECVKNNDSFCLCHGLAGNAEILLQVQSLLNRNDLEEAVISTARAGIKKYHENVTWPCGVPGGGQTPGLLLGLAGIGYFYLRLHDRSVPSPLYI
jgi:hypothetical protein